MTSPYSAASAPPHAVARVTAMRAVRYFMMRSFPKLQNGGSHNLMLQLRRSRHVSETSSACDNCHHRHTTRGSQPYRMAIERGGAHQADLASDKTSEHLPLAVLSAKRPTTDLVRFCE